MFDSSLKPGHLGKRHQISKRQDSGNGCSTANFYVYPKAGDIIDSAQQVNIQWNVNAGCLGEGKTDITIFVYNTETLKAKYTHVDYTQGAYSAQLDPAWWDSKKSGQLQFKIQEKDAIAAFSTVPPGPFFNVTYDPSQAPVVLGGGAAGTETASAATSSSSAVKSLPVNNFYTGQGLSAGKLAAAVVMPILAVMTAIAVYVFFSRRKEAKKRSRWSKAVDERMSRISGDWKPTSAAGAAAAVRNSLAVGDRNTRASSFYGIGRPSSNFATEGNADMQQIARPRAAAAADGTTRVSRVSFATESVYSRPSMGDALRPGSNYVTASRASRAYHVAHPVPPLPSIRRSDTDEIAALEMSPTQTSGPLTLDNDVIEARVSGNSSSLGAYAQEDGRYSVDAEIAHLALPAMQYTHNNASGATLNQELVSSPTEATTPSTGYTIGPYSATTPPSSMGLMPSMPMPSGVASPDDMLRAYASARTAQATIAPAPIPAMPAMPAPAATEYSNSPDAMLRAYAAARSNTLSTHSAASSAAPSTNSGNNPFSTIARVMSPPHKATRSDSVSRARSGSVAATAPPAVPAQTPIYAALNSGAAGTGRALYSPTMMQGLAAASNNPYRDSMVPSENENDPKWNVGMAE